MPIYEYECTCCGARFERRQSFSEDRRALCPHCQGHAQRVLHSVPIIFKGSGFYVTDHRTGGGYSGDSKSTAAVGESKPTAAAGETKPATATGESKPAVAAKES
ncbi:MAG: hypothetical protein HYX99_04955 [Chloroflexi bacterium]|nr:hypothetical protein [Chloroflexota bacterium]